MKSNDGIMAANFSSMNPERMKLKALRSGYHDYIQLQTLQQDLQWHICMLYVCIGPIMTFSVYMHFFQTFSASHLPFSLPLLLHSLLNVSSILSGSRSSCHFTSSSWSPRFNDWHVALVYQKKTKAAFVWMIYLSRQIRKHTMPL